jgi:DNA-binding NtrC family response regulator
VRIVSATNVDLRKLVREGKFRSDLYYRLSVVRISVPPLRERVDDIPLLAGLFLERLAPPGAIPKRLSPRALKLLISHDWPGNVRELQNVIERAALLSRGDEIGPGDIAFEDDDLDWQPDSFESLAYEEAKRLVLERFQRRYAYSGRDDQADRSHEQPVRLTPQWLPEGRSRPVLERTYGSHCGVHVRRSR